MNKTHVKTQRWSTSSSSRSADTSPVELDALKAHLHRCEDERGWLFGLKCAGDAFNLYMAPRVVTILVVFVLLSVMASLML